MNINIVYHSNYNGCDLSTDDGHFQNGHLAPEVEEQLQLISEQVVDNFCDECDEDGILQCSILHVKKFATDLVKAQFPDAVVTFEEDDFGS
jgi:hypothetical protein